jgi:large subunit ribosomal protein L6
LRDTKEFKSYYGLVRALLANMVLGVCKPYVKILVLEGVGYKFNLSSTQLTLHIGYTHLISFKIPETLSLKMDSATKLVISGINKELVGYFASKIRILRIPEPYKGKGILYENEKIRRKVGKTGKK